MVIDSRVVIDLTPCSTQCRGAKSRPYWVGRQCLGYQLGPGLHAYAETTFTRRVHKALGSMRHHRSDVTIAVVTLVFAEGIDKCKNQDDWAQHKGNSASH